MSVGLDIGGANTKIAVISFDEASKTQKSLMESIRFESIETVYLPLWDDLHKLPDSLKVLFTKYAAAPYLTAFTTTAELADCFKTKRQGIKHLLTVMGEIQPSSKVLLNDGRIVTLPIGQCNKRKIAAANWAAPSLLIGRIHQDAVFIDSGSTTTDVIPITNGYPQLEDPSDMGRLANHQLIYTGALRTNVATITDHVIVGGKKIGLAAENFSNVGDVNLVLGHISTSDYTVPTSDGRAATFSGALCRLSRIVCSDTDSLSKNQIKEIASYIHDKQVSRVSNQIRQLLENTDFDGDPKCVLAGIGRSCLAEPAAREAGLKDVVTLSEFLNSGLGINCEGMENGISDVAPATSLSILNISRNTSC